MPVPCSDRLGLPVMWEPGWVRPCSTGRSGAFGFNPLALVGLVVLGVLGALWTVEAAGGPAVRLPRPLAFPLRRVSPTRWLLVALSH